MFNPANLATEIFGILRSFDYVVNIFDFDGNRVYEPADARRFFASPKNITVSVHEDGENSGIKMFLSKSTDISEVAGLIATMRTTASKFGLLFNIRKYERELKPKDLAPNAAANYDAGVSLSDAEGEEEELTPEKEINNDDDQTVDASDDTNDVEPEKLDTISTSLDKLKDSLPKMIVALKKKKEMQENMSNSKTPIIESDEHDIGTTPLKAFGIDVNTAAWDEFKKGVLSFNETPNMSISQEDRQKYEEDYESKSGMPVDPDLVTQMIQMTRIISSSQDETLRTLFQKCLDFLATGTPSQITSDVITKAIEAGSKAASSAAEQGAQTVQDSDAPLSPNTANASVARPAMAESTGLIMSESIRDFGRWFDSLSSVAIFEDDRVSRLMRDRDPYSDSTDKALDIAASSVLDNFSVQDFLSSHGSDFNYGDDTLDTDDKTLSYHYVRASLVHYLEQRLEDTLNGTEYPAANDVYGIADDLMKDVIETMTNEGWTISDQPNMPLAEEELDEGLRLVSQHHNADKSKSAKVYKDNEWNEHRVKFYKDGVHQTEADYHTDAEDADLTAKDFVKEDIDVSPYDSAQERVSRNQDAPSFAGQTERAIRNSDAFHGIEGPEREAAAHKEWMKLRRKRLGWGEAPEDTHDFQEIEEEELASEDVLLSKNPANSLTREITADEDPDVDIARMVALSKNPASPRRF